MNTQDDLPIDFDWAKIMSDFVSLNKPEVPPKVGQRLGAKVLARAPFGMWLNLGNGNVGLLLIPDVVDERGEKSGYNGFRNKGEEIEVTVHHIDSDGKIALRGVAEGIEENK